MSDAVVISLVTAGAVVGASVISSRKLDAIHVLVNQRLTEALEEIVSLKVAAAVLKEAADKLLNGKEAP